MTIVACWINREREPGWACAVSDSRIRSSSGSILSDSVAKIFAVPVVCRRPGQSGFFDNVHFSTSIGMAVAGSALVNLNLYASLTPVVSNLICLPGNPGHPLDAIPSLADIALLTSRLLRKLILELGATMGDQAQSEVVIFGFCHKAGRNRIFRLSPIEDSDIDPPFSVQTREENTSDPGHVVLLGRGREEMIRRIAKIRENKSEDITWWRAPERALKQLIEDHADESVGGPVQIAWGSAGGVNLYARVLVQGSSQGNLRTSYLGIDLLEDVGMVGPCRSSMDAML